MKHGSAYMASDVTGHTLSHSPGGMSGNITIKGGTSPKAGLKMYPTQPKMSPKGKMANTKK